MNRLLQEKGGRVLAFGAHPDDLEVGAGGLLARLADEGAEVTLAVVSIPSNAEQRKAEAHAGADVLDAELFILYEEQAVPRRGHPDARARAPVRSTSSATCAPTS